MHDEIPIIQVEADLKKPDPNLSSTITDSLYVDYRKIYVKHIAGLFQRIRNSTLWMLILSYFAVGWVSIDGQQLLHFDLPARKFYIYGMTFWPQDFALLSFLLIIAAFGLFFVTTLFGRLWCGYTCPQTAWTFIFIWIEEKVEGTRNQRIKLDKSRHTPDKIAKKIIKHSLWLLISFATGLTFVGYFYPIRELVPDVFTFSVTGLWPLFWIAFFTFATYLNAGWLREQVCLYMCPYARFQSVMYDSNTLVVAYDAARGNPRGSRKKGIEPKEKGLGYCVDCNLCVQVCPTGIDIRNGLQYECIGCALCIDACDSVMDKMNYAPKLISYSTEEAQKGNASSLLRPKSLAYAAILFCMLSSFGYTIITRIPLELDVIKDRGSLFQLTGLGMIENSYTLKVMNMSNKDHPYKISVSGINNLKINTETLVTIKSGEIYSLPTSVEVSPSEMQETQYEIEFTVQALDDDGLVATSESRFLGSPE